MDRVPPVACPKTVVSLSLDRPRTQRTPGQSHFSQMNMLAILILYRTSFNGLPQRGKIKIEKKKRKNKQANNYGIK